MYVYICVFQFQIIYKASSFVANIQIAKKRLVHKNCYYYYFYKVVVLGEITTHYHCTLKN